MKDLQFIALILFACFLTSANPPFPTRGFHAEARYQAYIEAARLWQQFQAQLEAERKKRQQKKCANDKPCPVK